MAVQIAPRRLARRLFVFLLLLGVLPLCLGGVIAYSRFSHHIGAEISATTRAMADGGQIAVRDFLDYLRGRTIDIAADWYIADSLDGGRGAPELSRYLRLQRS